MTGYDIIGDIHGHAEELRQRRRGRGSYALSVRDIYQTSSPKVFQIHAAKSRRFRLVLGLTENRVDRASCVAKIVPVRELIT